MVPSCMFNPVLYILNIIFFRVAMLECFNKLNFNKLTRLFITFIFYQN